MAKNTKPAPKKSEPPQFNPQDLAAGGEMHVGDAAAATDPSQGSPPDQPVENLNGDASSQAPPAQPPPTQGAPPATVLIEVPVHRFEEGFANPRVDFRCTPRQAAALNFLFCSLTDRGDRFEGGRSLHPKGTPVGVTVNDAVRWMLDRIADGIEADTGKSITNDFGFTFR
jgi:hypothetical protein